MTLILIGYSCVSAETSRKVSIDIRAGSAVCSKFNETTPLFIQEAFKKGGESYQNLKCNQTATENDELVTQMATEAHVKAVETLSGDIKKSLITRKIPELQKQIKLFNQTLTSVRAPDIRLEFANVMKKCSEPDPTGVTLTNEVNILLRELQLLKHQPAVSRRSAPVSEIKLPENSPARLLLKMAKDLIAICEMDPCQALDIDPSETATLVDSLKTKSQDTVWVAAACACHLRKNEVVTWRQPPPMLSPNPLRTSNSPQPNSSVVTETKTASGAPSVQNSHSQNSQGSQSSQSSTSSSPAQSAVRQQATGPQKAPASDSAPAAPDSSQTGASHDSVHAQTQKKTGSTNEKPPLVAPDSTIKDENHSNPTISAPSAKAGLPVQKSNIQVEEVMVPTGGSGDSAPAPNLPKASAPTTPQKADAGPSGNTSGTAESANPAPTGKADSDSTLEKPKAAPASTGGAGPAVTQLPASKTSPEAKSARGSKAQGPPMHYYRAQVVAPSDKKKSETTLPEKKIPSAEKSQRSQNSLAKSDKVPRPEEKSLESENSSEFFDSDDDMSFERERQKALKPSEAPDSSFATADKPGPPKRAKDAFSSFEEKASPKNSEGSDSGRTGLRSPGAREAESQKRRAQSPSTSQDNSKRPRIGSHLRDGPDVDKPDSPSSMGSNSRYSDDQDEPRSSTSSRLEDDAPDKAPSGRSQIQSQARSKSKKRSLASLGGKMNKIGTSVVEEAESLIQKGRDRDAIQLIQRKTGFSYQEAKEIVEILKAEQY